MLIHRVYLTVVDMLRRQIGNIDNVVVVVHMGRPVAF